MALFIIIHLLYINIVAIPRKRKNLDGEEQFGFLPIRFRKGASVADKTVISIKNAWLDFYRPRSENAYDVFYIMCTDFVLAADDDAERKLNTEKAEDTEMEFEENITVY